MTDGQLIHLELLANFRSPSSCRSRSLELVQLRAREMSVIDLPIEGQATKPQPLIRPHPAGLHFARVGRLNVSRSIVRAVSLATIQTRARHRCVSAIWMGATTAATD